MEHRVVGVGHHLVQLDQAFRRDFSEYYLVVLRFLEVHLLLKVIFGDGEVLDKVDGFVLELLLVAIGDEKSGVGTHFFKVITLNVDHLVVN